MIATVKCECIPAGNAMDVMVFIWEATTYVLIQSFYALILTYFDW